MEKRGYHGSADSLITGAQENTLAIEDAFQQQCNQVFIGMVTMQYQAKQVNKSSSGFCFKYFSFKFSFSCNLFPNVSNLQGCSGVNHCFLLYSPISNCTPSALQLLKHEFIA